MRSSVVSFGAFIAWKLVKNMAKRARRSASVPRLPSVQPVCPFAPNTEVGVTAEELDLQSMIANARHQHEQRVQQARDKAEKERETQTRIEEDGTNWLKRHLIPFLDRAKRTFQTQGVPIEMGSNFGVLRSISAKPTVWFRCAGPSTVSGQVTPISRPAYFRCDGQALEIGLGNSNIDEPWSPDRILSSVDVAGADIKSAIAAAIQSVLESYYAELEAQLCNRSPTPGSRCRVKGRAN